MLRKRVLSSINRSSIVAIGLFLLAGCGGGGGGVGGASAAGPAGSSAVAAPSASGTSASSTSTAASSTSSTSGASTGTGGTSGGGSTAPPTTSTPPTGSATVSWSAPTINTNGTALTDLAGYHIYYGTSATALTQRVDIASASATSYVLQNLASGTWYFEVTAVTNTGAESAPSAVVSKTLT